MDRVHRLHHLAAAVLILCAAAAGCLAGESGSASAPDTVVLFSASDPQPMRQFACPGEACRWVNIDDFACDRREAGSPSVVVTGHSLPPSYLGATAERLARAIQCFGPQLLVLDTCYGYSEPLLSQLAQAEDPPLVIGSVDRVEPSGFDYGADFFDSVSIRQRAAAVSAAEGTRLYRWTPERQALLAADASAGTWDRQTLLARLRHVQPNLVEVPLPEIGASILLHLPPQRFRDRDVARAGPATGRTDSATQPGPRAADQPET